MKATIASTEPAKKPIRQAQSRSASSPNVAWSTTSSASALSCPPMIVTYWKLDQKPRRSRPAISDK
jgi:hypothetical protein